MSVLHTYHCMIGHIVHVAQIATELGNLEIPKYLIEHNITIKDASYDGNYKMVLYLAEN